MSQYNLECIFYQEPLISYLKAIPHFIEEDDILPTVIPETVVGENYVSLHLLLRRYDHTHII